MMGASSRAAQFRLFQTSQAGGARVLCSNFPALHWGVSGSCMAFHGHPATSPAPTSTIPHWNCSLLPTLARPLHISRTLQRLVYGEWSPIHPAQMPSPPGSLLSVPQGKALPSPALRLVSPASWALGSTFSPLFAYANPSAFPAALTPLHLSHLRSDVFSSRNFPP